MVQLLLRVLSLQKTFLHLLLLEVFLQKFYVIDLTKK